MLKIKYIQEICIVGINYSMSGKTWGANLSPQVFLLDQIVRNLNMNKKYYRDNKIKLGLILKRVLF